MELVSKYDSFHTRKLTWKMAANWRPFYLGHDVFMDIFIAYTHLWQRSGYHHHPLWRMFSIQSHLADRNRMWRHTRIHGDMSRSIPRRCCDRVRSPCHTYPPLVHTRPRLNKNNAFNTLRPRQNGRHFADDTFKRIFSKKMSEFRLKFHWGLFLRVQLTISQHCFRYWLGADQATSHYLKQWW